jgi:hypothetical protein
MPLDLDCMAERFEDAAKKRPPLRQGGAESRADSGFGVSPIRAAPGWRPFSAPPRTLARAAIKEERSGVRPVVEVTLQQSAFAGGPLPFAYEAGGIDLQQQRRRAAFAARFGKEDASLAERKVERLRGGRVLRSKNPRSVAGR